MEFPRRCYLEKMTPEERGIHDMIKKVENLGCDVRLTETIILLGQARDKLSDFVDGIPPADSSPR